MIFISFMGLLWKNYKPQTLWIHKTIYSYFSISKRP